MRYILGAGINGLIFGLYNPDYIIVDTTDPQSETNIDLKLRDSIVALYDNQETAQLLTDLGMDYYSIEKVSSPIYYYFNDKPYKECPKIMRDEYDACAIVQQGLNTLYTLLPERCISNSQYFIYQ